MSFLSLINEAKAKGPKVYTSKEGTKGKGRSGTFKTTKTKATTYTSIMQALKVGSFGDIFTTDGSDRLYVITKRKWGSDPEQTVGSKVAKGFTPGSATPSADEGSIRAHAKRTRARYGGGDASKNLKKLRK